MSDRGTSNTNVRGNSKDRRRRREYLVETYRSNIDLLLDEEGNLYGALYWDQPHGEIPEGITRHKTCRCYRCGHPLTVDTVTVDRRVPGCQGGTYRRDNIRPACLPCNSETGGRTRSGKKKSC